MKKALIILLCIIMCIILSGCTMRLKKSETSLDTVYAMIIMPDGIIIKGVCDTVEYVTSNYMEIIIDGIKYSTHISRVVIWEVNN